MNWPLKIGQPRFLSIDQVNDLHAFSLNEFGGLAGVRDAGLLQSACAQASTGFGGKLAHEFPFGMAAAYGYHIAKNHPFFDGNKRTAFGASATFLYMNGWELITSQENAAETFVKVAEGSVDKAALAQWLESNCRQRPSLELRDFFQNIDISHFRERLEALFAAPNMEEQIATLQEASNAMPFVLEITEAITETDAENYEKRKRLLSTQLVTFALLYRIAEDMGYEW